MSKSTTSASCTTPNKFSTPNPHNTLNNNNNNHHHNQHNNNHNNHNRSKIVTTGESNLGEKLAKCELMQHQKQVQVKAKQEELKSKTKSRIMANKERRLKAEEERMQKYKYEELRKQVAREKIAELNKNTKPKKTHQLTPIKFKTHSDLNPTTLYAGKDTSNLSNLPSKKKDQRSQFNTLATIQDISVDVTVQSNQQLTVAADNFNNINFDNEKNKDITKNNDKNNLLSVLDDGDLSLIKDRDQHKMFEEKLTAISSTPFNNVQNNRRSLNNIDVTFNENTSYLPVPELNLVVKDVLNFSSTLPVADNQHHTSDEQCNDNNNDINQDNNNNNNSTFVVEKENSRKHSSINAPQYEMTIVDSQATSEDDDYYVQCSDSNKPIPDWARSEQIWQSITKQITEKKLVADNIFGPIPRVNMNDIFKSTNRDFGNRNNSSMFNDSSIDIN